ncbi:MAG: class I SAM-dependent methyltransferase [Actinomycetota bacterium]
MFDRGRRWVTARARGATLEVGVGTGLNIPLYGEEVEVTGLDLSSSMLAQARGRARSLNRTVTLVEGDAQSMPFPDERFDTVVFSLVLCTVPEVPRAVAEGKRVLRPGGRLLLLEHVRSPNPVVRFGQRPRANLGSIPGRPPPARATRRRARGGVHPRDPEPGRLGDHGGHPGTQALGQIASLRS